MKKLIALATLLTILVTIYFATFTATETTTTPLQDTTQQNGYTIHNSTQYSNKGNDIVAYILTCNITKDEITKEVELTTYQNILRIEKRVATLIN